MTFIKVLLQLTLISFVSVLILRYFTIKYLGTNENKFNRSS